MVPPRGASGGGAEAGTFTAGAPDMSSYIICGSATEKGGGLAIAAGLGIGASSLSSYTN